MRRFSLALASLLLLLILFTAFSLGTASAATNSVTRTTHPAYANCGGTCFNKDPYTTGCGSPGNAYDAHDIGVYDHLNNKLLSIHNWYSTLCGTNWNVTYPTYSNAYFPQISIQSAGFNTTMLCEPQICTQWYTGSGSPLWTNMVYAPANPPTKATACGAAMSFADNHRYSACITA